MFVKPIKKGLGAVLAVGLVFVSLCCSRSADEVAPDVDQDVEYSLTGLRYFMSTDDGVDTVSVDLESIRLHNSSDVLTQQQVEGTFEGLQKTSSFKFDNALQLPEGVVLDQFKVSVPARWLGADTFSFFGEKFPFTAEVAEMPYPLPDNQLLDVTIPPNATVVVERKIDAYHLTCSFTAQLTNTTTGEQYAVTGKWLGVSGYNNSSIVLTEEE